MKKLNKFKLPRNREDGKDPWTPIKAFLLNLNLPNEHEENKISLKRSIIRRYYEKIR